MARQASRTTVAASIFILVMEPSLGGLYCANCIREYGVRRAPDEACAVAAETSRCLGPLGAHPGLNLARISIQFQSGGNSGADLADERRRCADDSTMGDLSSIHVRF